MDTRELQGSEYDECYPLNETRIELKKYQGCHQHKILYTVKHMILEFQGTLASKVIPYKFYEVFRTEHSSIGGRGVAVQPQQQSSNPLQLSSYRLLEILPKFLEVSVT
jgi:hypothetical protein